VSDVRVSQVSFNTVASLVIVSAISFNPSAVVPEITEFSGGIHTRSGFWSDGTTHDTWARKKKRPEVIDKVIEEVILEHTPVAQTAQIESFKPLLSQAELMRIREYALTFAIQEQAEQYARQQVIKLLKEIDEEEALIMLLLS